MVALLLLSTVCSYGATESEKMIYIQTFKDIAINESMRSNIPTSIILAQGLLESEAGKSELARNSHNHFGIKCKSEWTGGKYYKQDDDRDEYGNLINSCFRVYTDVAQSYIDHSNFLMQRERYQRLFDFKKTDYINWAVGLQQCGYATNNQYALRLIDLIEKYELHHFDRLAHHPFVNANSAPITTVTEKNTDIEVPLTSTPTAEVVAIPPAVYIGEDYQRGQHDRTENLNAPESYTAKSGSNIHTNTHTLKKRKEDLPPVTSSKYSNTMRTVYVKRLQTQTYVPKANNARR